MAKAKNKGKATASGDKTPEVEKAEETVSENTSAKEETNTIEEPVTEKSEVEMKEQEQEPAADGEKAEGEGEEKEEEKKEEGGGEEKDKERREEGGEKPKEDKPKPKKKNKKIAGFIFMCNSKTKEECFRHKVFALPKQHIDTVKNIKKGAFLFLYDVDMRLMYGIYRASGRGNANLVPKAFKGMKGKFPAQVRFNIHKECTPVAEAKFKKAIKENYKGKSKKFKYELSQQQVKRLQKLFKPIALNQRGPRSARKGPASHRARADFPGSQRQEQMRAPMPLAYAPQVEYARDYAPPPPTRLLPRADDLYAADPYGSVYQRSILPPLDLLRSGVSDPLYLRSAMDPLAARSGYDPLYARGGYSSEIELSHLYQQRARDEAYLDELRRVQYVDPYARRAEIPPSSGAYSSYYRL